MGNTVQKVVYPGPYPETFGKPTYESNYGFPAERKKRESSVPEVVLINAKVPKELRDYCAHLFLDYLACHRREFPLPQRCAKEVYAYHKCEYDDQVLRMKEYERERRLLKREQKKQKAVNGA